MATSITASTVSPFTGLLLQDTNYSVNGAFPVGTNVTGSTAALYFPNISFPEVGRFIVQVSNTALTNTSGSLVTSMSLQHSADGVTWVQIPQFATNLLAATDGGALSAPANSAQVMLPPNVNPYIRGWVNVPTGAATAGGITGSYSVTALF